MPLQVVVKREWLHATELQFPAVTVCNTNPVKQSLTHLSPRMNALLERLAHNRRRKRRSVEAAGVDDVIQSLEDDTGDAAKHILSADGTIDGSERVRRKRGLWMITGEFSTLYTAVRTL